MAVGGVCQHAKSSLLTPWSTLVLPCKHFPDERVASQRWSPRSSVCEGFQDACLTACFTLRSLSRRAALLLLGLLAALAARFGRWMLPRLSCLAALFGPGRPRLPALPDYTTLSEARAAVCYLEHRCPRGADSRRHFGCRRTGGSCSSCDTL